ncbi:unnamed protein product [Trichogramma brassicae]|uniref:HTH psq-type domain-containing protein n=1 Tax=Trichogramma brassicae TaxID=86971 RepID=A0A6H5I5H6_9HYME|nr:unnamed protein product [Trichogramma brassicae]
MAEDKRRGRRRSRPPIFTEKEERQLVHYMNARSAMENGIGRARMRRIAYQYAVAKRLRYPASWDEAQQAGLTWLRSFTVKNRQKLTIKPEELLAARDKEGDSSFDEDEDLEDFDPFEDAVVIHEEDEEEEEENADEQEDEEEKEPPEKKRRVGRRKKEVDKSVVLQAIEDVTSKRLNLREASRLYDVALTTLHLHLRIYRSVGGSAEAYLSQTIGRRRGFASRDESAIVEHVNRCADAEGCRLGRKRARRLVYEFVRGQGMKYPKGWDEREIASTSWMLGFIVKHGQELKLDEKALKIGSLTSKNSVEGVEEDALDDVEEDSESCSVSNEYVDGINDSYLLNEDDASESFPFDCQYNEEKGVAIEEVVIAPSKASDDEVIIESYDVMDEEPKAEEKEYDTKEEERVADEEEEIARYDREEEATDEVENVKMVRTFYHFPDMVYETFEPVGDVNDNNCDIVEDECSEYSDECVDVTEDHLLDDSINDNFVEITNEHQAKKQEINANYVVELNHNDIEIINVSSDAASSPEPVSKKIFTDEEESQLVDYINSAASSELLLTLKQAKKLTYEYATKQIRKYSRVYDAWRAFDTSWMRQFYARHRADFATTLDPREFEADGDDEKANCYKGKKLKPGKYVYDVANLHKALDGIVAGDWSVKEGSDLFNIAPATLQHHKRLTEQQQQSNSSSCCSSSSSSSSSSKAETNYELHRIWSDEQERDLVTHLNKMARAEGGLTRKRYRKEIYAYAKNTPGTRYPGAWDMLDMASSYWTQGFMKKHKDRLCLSWPVKVIKSH